MEKASTDIIGQSDGPTSIWVATSSYLVPVAAVVCLAIVLTVAFIMLRRKKK